MDWAFNVGKFSQEANEWYKDMKQKTGVEPRDGSFEDFQRIFKCNDIQANDCNDQGLQYPFTCSHPPCNTCSMNQPGKYIKICHASSCRPYFIFPIRYAKLKLFIHQF